MVVAFRNNLLLLKKGDLEPREFNIIKEHPEKGWRILEQSKIVKPYAYGAKYLHERYGGSGNNEGLKGEEIPIEARIIAVADAYDAMRSERPYESGRKLEEIKRELMKSSGTHFDPNVVENLMKVLNRRHNMG